MRDLNDLKETEEWANEIINKQGGDLKEEMLALSLEEKIKRIILGASVAKDNIHLNSFITLFGAVQLWKDERFDFLSIGVREFKKNDSIH